MRGDENDSARYARSLIEASVDPLVTINALGKITDVNVATERVTGKPRADLIGTDFAEYFTEPEKARQGYEQVFLKGQVTDYPLAIRHLNGQVTEVLYNASVYKDAHGNVSGVFAAARDVTERKQAELKLERANRALQTLSACNQVLVHTQNEQHLLDQICRLLVDIGGYRMAWIGVPDTGDEHPVRPVASYGRVDDFFDEIKISWADNRYGRGPTGTAIRTGTIQTNQDFATNAAMIPWREAAAKRGYRSSIALPLKGTTGMLGAITIYADTACAFTETEVVLLRELTDDLVFGIETLRTRVDRDRIALENLHHDATLRSSLEDTIRAIANTIETRDPYTSGHQRRVGDLAVAIAVEMRLPQSTIHGIELAASIHDLGKVSIPSEILCKPTRLTDIEYTLVDAG